MKTIKIVCVALFFVFAVLAVVSVSMAESSGKISMPAEESKSESYKGFCGFGVLLVENLPPEHEDLNYYIGLAGERSYLCIYRNGENVVPDLCERRSRKENLTSRYSEVFTGHRCEHFAPESRVNEWGFGLYTTPTREIEREYGDDMAKHPCQIKRVDKCGRS